MNNALNNISHIGDIFAIPLFLLTFLYFYEIEEKSLVEYILLFFSLSGLLLDSIFTFIWISRHW